MFERFGFKPLLGKKTFPKRLLHDLIVKVIVLLVKKKRPAVDVGLIPATPCGHIYCYVKIIIILK